MLDVIMTSSCRSVIEKTICSFFDRVSCSYRLRFIVHIDVLSPDSLPFVQKFLEKVEHYTRSEVIIRINRNPDPISNNAHTKAVNYLFKQIQSEYYFHLEDDWIFLKDIDFDTLIGLMQKHEDMDHIRFSKEIIKDKSWLYHLSDDISAEYLYPNTEVTIDDIPLVKTPVWSFNPHIGRTSIIKNFTNIPLEYNPERYVCHYYPKLINHGSIYIYGKIGDSRIVKDIGRSKLKEKLRKYKYMISGGKYADYKY